MSSRKPTTPHKGQKPVQPPRPGRGGRPLTAQRIIVTSERLKEPDLRLIARAVIRLAQGQMATLDKSSGKHQGGEEPS